MSHSPPRTIPLPLSAAQAGGAHAAPPGHASYGKNPFASQAKMLWHLGRLASYTLS